MLAHCVFIFVIPLNKFHFSQKGDHHKMTVKAGDHVLLPQWGENKVVIDEKVSIPFAISFYTFQEYFLFRESELLGKFTK
jgi:hypothetical protein